MTSLQEILDSLKTEQDVDLKIRWDEVHHLVKELYSKDSGTSVFEMDTVLDDILLLFFQKWSQLKLLSAGTFTTFLHCTKLYNELTELKETGIFVDSTIGNLSHRLLKLRESFSNCKIHVDEPFLHQALSMFQHKLSQCDHIIKELKKEIQGISPALKGIHTRLVEIKQELSSLLARKNPRAFSLIEVQVLQDEVVEIDSARIDGKFMTRNGAVVPGQASIIYLLESCFEDIHELLASRDPLDAENPMRNIYEDLIKIKSALEHMMLYSRWSLKGDDLIPYQVRLGEIDNMRVDGKFLSLDGKIPQGQAVLHFLLHKCYRIIYKLQADCEPVAESLMPIYNQLFTLKKCLLQLKKWNVHLTYEELIPYQMKLNSTHALQRDGKFYDSEGNIPEGQATLFELLADCHELVRNLQINNE